MNEELNISLSGHIPYPFFDNGYAAYVQPPPDLQEKLKTIFGEAILAIIQTRKPPSYEHCFKSLKEFHKTGIVVIKSLKPLPPSKTISVNVKPLFAVTHNGRVDWTLLVLP